MASGKIMLGGEKIILASGAKMNLASGEIILGGAKIIFVVGKIILGGEKLFGQMVQKLFWRVGKLFW